MGGRTTDYWEWETSRLDPDDATDTYYDPTGVSPQDYGNPNHFGFRVRFASIQLRGSVPWARYDDLASLMADIETIESYRYGDPLPDLPRSTDRGVASEREDILDGARLVLANPCRSAPEQRPRATTRTLGT